MAKFWKLAPGVALTVAVALLVAGVLIAAWNESAYREQKIDEVTVQAQILASSVTAALVFNDEETVQEYVNAQKANPEILAAAVYNSSGALVAGYSRGEVGTIPDTVQPREPAFVEDRVIVAVPVTQDRAFFGTVYLRTITEPILRRLARYGAVGLLIVMASLVVAVLGSAQAALTRANRELQDRASDLAEANLLLRNQITEREKVEEALRQSQKMEAIGQLSGGIAHDFNNLLTVVQGNLQLLQRRLAQGQTNVARYVDLAMDGVTRATHVTQRILAFSRRQPLSPKPVNLNRLIEDMDALLQHSVGAVVTFEKRLDADWWTLCDPNQMENVVLNLVINARDAMPDGGKMVISTENLDLAAAADGFEDVLPGHYIRLSIADSGVGMSEDVRKKAIDPFFTTKPIGQGTGLGLSMIFGYVKQSKGALRIESTLGQGTTVTILLPRHGTGVIDERSNSIPTGVVPHVPMEAQLQIRTPTVFIVEDEDLVRELASEAIRSEGYNVVEAADGTSALRTLKSDFHIHLLITDVKLPGVNGFQLAEYAKASRPDLQILIVTGFTNDPIPEKLIEAGVKVLYKPYDLDELASQAKGMLQASLS